VLEVGIGVAIERDAYSSQFFGTTKHAKRYRTMKSMKDMKKERSSGHPPPSFFMLFMSFMVKKISNSESQSIRHIESPTE
jgi:hypothetical protein